MVTLTFDLWPLKSIGSILSPWLKCLPSLIKKYTMVWSLSCSQAYFHICLLWPWPLTSDLQNVCQVWPRSTKRFSRYRVHKLISIYVHCDLDLWPLTSKINRVHPLTMVNMSAKFDKEIHIGLVSIVFTSLFPYMPIVTLTFDLQNQ